MAIIAEAPKLFGKWSFDDIEISDISLEDYIAAKPKYATYRPHTAGRYAQKRFRKAACPIVERMTNSMMYNGRNNGKKLLAVRIMKHTLEIIHLTTDQNPVQVVPQPFARFYRCAGKVFGGPASTALLVTNAARVLQR